MLQRRIPCYVTEMQRVGMVEQGPGATQRSRLRMRKISNALHSERGSYRGDDDFSHGRNTTTVSFSYAMAVEKALRRQYHVQVFGPLSAKPRPQREVGIEVTKLPDIYRDFSYLNKLVYHNKRYTEKLKEEVTYEPYYGVDDGKTRLPKLRSRKNRSRENTTSQTSTPKVSTGSVTKLPPIDKQR